VDSTIIQSMKVFAIIPARSGSRRIQHKNIYQIDGIPLVGIVLEKLNSTDLFFDIIVSTDSAKFAAILEEYGVSIPELRPQELADDMTSTYDVMKYEITKATQISPEDIVFCVYPTAILHSANDLQRAIESLRENPNGYVISSIVSGFSPLRSYTFKNNEMEMLFPEYFNYRSQDLPKVYSDAGMFYAATKQTWVNKQIEYGGVNQIIEIPRSRAVDINDIDDLRIAELLFRHQNEITKDYK
jgi:pseudaminic acid cytidylyltransferase